MICCRGHFYRVETQSRYLHRFFKLFRLQYLPFFEEVVMADDADLANAYLEAYIDNEVSRAVKKIRQDTAPKTATSTICKECGEKLPRARLEHGFDLCVPCASEEERRKALFAHT